MELEVIGGGEWFSQGGATLGIHEGRGVTWVRRGISNSNGACPCDRSTAKHLQARIMGNNARQMEHCSLDDSSQSMYSFLDLRRGLHSLYPFSFFSI